MKDRTRAWWRRHAALAAAALLHIVLLWLILPYLVNRTEPLDDSVDVAIVPPTQLPKPVHPKPAPRPAEKNSTSGRPSFQPAPRLAHVPQPQINLPLPPPVPAKTDMTLPVASGTPAAGPRGSGNGTGG